MAESSEEKKNSECQKSEVFCVPVERTENESGILGRGEGVEESRKDEWYLPKAGELGHGVSSSVYKVCKHNQDCNYVMKCILFNPKDFSDSSYVEQSELPNWYMNTRDNFLKEVELHKEAFKLGVAPDIIDSWICENPYIGVIIMPALRRTLEDILIDPEVSADKKKKYVNDAKKILIAMNLKNIFHRDPHPNNFMVDSNQTLKIIDFGLAEKLVKHDDAVKPRHSSKLFQKKKIPGYDFWFFNKKLAELANKYPVLLKDVLHH